MYPALLMLAGGEQEESFCRQCRAGWEDWARGTIRCVQTDDEGGCIVLSQRDQRRADWGKANIDAQPQAAGSQPHRSNACEIAVATAPRTANVCSKGLISILVSVGNK